MVALLTSLICEMNRSNLYFVFSILALCLSCVGSPKRGANHQMSSSEAINVGDKQVSLKKGQAESMVLKPFAGHECEAYVAANDSAPIDVVFPQFGYSFAFQFGKLLSWKSIEKREFYPSQYPSTRAKVTEEGTLSWLKSDD